MGDDGSLSLFSGSAPFPDGFSPLQAREARRTGGSVVIDSAAAMPLDGSLVRALLDHIERPVALCDPAGRLVATNTLFRHELLEQGAPENGLSLSGTSLVDASGQPISLPLIRSELGAPALLGPEWLLLELPGRVVSRPALARIFENLRHTPSTLLQLQLHHGEALRRHLGDDLQDSLLDALERRLFSLLPQGSTLCRGRDQRLLALIPSRFDHQSLRRAALRWSQRLAAPLVLAQHRLEPQLSLGFSRFPEDGERFEALLDASERDLLARQPKPSPQTHPLAGPLALAIDERRLNLHFQPIVDMASGRIEGAEVLCRWRDPQLGVISPCEFIAVAEAGDQINLLGSWLVDTVFAQIRAWRDRQIGLDYVSINISPLQLHDDRLLAWLCEGLRRYGLSASGIMLEMTENQAFETSAEVRRRLWSLHELGFTLAMDDYGTGYSSMQRLASLPFQGLKVDRCLIEAIDTDPLQQAMLRGVVELQQATGLRVVVEGVERPEQRRRLLELGCRVGQGFLFSHPLSAGELERELRARAEELPRQI